MLLTIGRFKRAFLYKRLLGSKNVKRVMRNGVQIWPDERDKVRRLVLELPKSGTDDYVYWQHVEAGLDKGVNLEEEKGAVKGMWARCSVDGRVWYWKKELVTKYPLKNELATWDERGELDFGEDGPYRGAIREGDLLSVQTNVPESETAKYGGWILQKVDFEGIAPALRGTQLKVYGGKGSKRTNLGWRIKLVSMPSGKELSEQWRYIRGKKRWWGTDSFNVPYDNTCQSLTMKYANEEGPSTVQAWLVYPGFKRTFKLKVLDVVYNG